MKNDDCGMSTEALAALRPEVYERAAELVLTGDELAWRRRESPWCCCWAIHCAVRGSDRVFNTSVLNDGESHLARFAEYFGIRSRAYWFGDRPSEGNQKHRATALLLMAAMVRAARREQRRVRR